MDLFGMLLALVGAVFFVFGAALSISRTLP